MSVVLPAARQASFGLAVSLTAVAGAQQSFHFDLRVNGTGGKDVVLTDPGDTVTLDLYMRISGSDASVVNDRLNITFCKILSGNGGLLGDLVGLPPVAPFNLPGAVPGRQNDMDGDGDLDIGSNDRSGAYAPRVVQFGS
jgi:hypothetical protein